MNDLFTQAMKYLDDRGMPDPDSLKLIDSGPLHRIEMDYHCPASDLPPFEWIPTNSGTHEKAEMVLGGVLVSIYATRSKVTA